jgi:hypothetical protein
MKKIFYLVYITAFILFSCENDDPMLKMKAPEDIAPPQIVSQADGFTKEVTDANRSEAIEFAWDETGYGVSTEVIYTLEVTTECGSFDNAIVLSSTTNPFVTMTLESLSAKLVDDLKIAPHELSELQMRVTSTINGNYLSISEPIHMSITPWSAKPFGLWIGQGNDAQVILNKTGALYEGYRFIEAGTTFKFANNSKCADTFYGSAGAGILSLSETSNSITIADEGYYKFNIDTQNLTYQIVKINTWGLIGSATAGSWDTSTPMQYNEATEQWEIQASLSSGALKFRANDWWDINYGAANIDNLTGDLVFDAAAIDIKQAGTYLITIDFSRNTSPYSTYKYSVERQLEPAKLWLPGGYQGYNPAAAPTIYATGSTTFEGYVYISGATGFKFTSQPDWSHTNYGYGGTAGTLSTDGAAPDIDLSAGGYYKFNVNIAALTYSATLIETWGLIGTATTGAWDVSTPMTFNQGTNTWTVTTDLTVGALKFRANNWWDVNYGVADINALEGSLVFDAASIDIKEAGNYTITLDFSKSEAPYEYTYSVVKN